MKLNKMLIFVLYRIFNLHSCELNGITKQFNELVMKLYKNVSAQEEKQIQCSSLVLNSKCKRAGSVKVQVSRFYNKETKTKNI